MSNSGCKTPVVLVVEDDPLLRIMAVDVVEQAGFEAVEVYDAAMAIDILEQRADIRVVFSDIDVPRGLEGMRLVALIRERWPPIELILTSSRRVPEAGQMPERSRFFSKPYHVEDVVAALQQMAMRQSGVARTRTR